MKVNGYEFSKYPKIGILKGLIKENEDEEEKVIDINKNGLIKALKPGFTGFAVMNYSTDENVYVTVYVNRN